MEAKLKILALVSLIAISGCGLFETTTEVVDNPTVVVINNKDLASKITSSLKEAPKEDCILIYKFLSGLSSYIRNVKNDDLTTDEVLNKTLLKAQTDYGWNRDKYPAFSQTISDDLINKKLDDPHKLGDSTSEGKIRDILSSSIDEYANIIKNICESK